MNYLRTVKIEQVWEHAGIDWRNGLPGSAVTGAAVWRLATPVRDQDMQITDSKFYKSVRDECNEVGKKGSLLTMLNQLRYAIRHEDYQAFLKNTNIQIKEAFHFDFSKKKHKVWELKYQNKDRVYFFTHQIAGDQPIRLLIPLLFHHKKDQTTPKPITEYCEKTIKPFLTPNSEINILKESP